MKRISDILNEEKAGLYLTLIVHLLLLIVILSVSIKSLTESEASFVLDFTAQEELEERQRKEALTESVSNELDELIRQSSREKMRAVSVDFGNKALKDDRSKNPNEVYDEARRLQEKLDASREEARKAKDSEDDVANKDTKVDDGPKEVYTGPSVLTWSLDNRQAVYLPIPAYSCKGGGDVCVMIVVSRRGAVLQTKVVEEVSSPDACLRNYALRAAAKSKFNRDDSAEEKQIGEIVYRFIAQ